MTISSSPSLEAAARLYERDGDATASLNACRLLWNENDRTPPSTANADSADEADSKSTAEATATTTPLSRRHNQVVLDHLSSIAWKNRRRRIRRRPSWPSSLGEDDGEGGAAAASDAAAKNSVDNAATKADEQRKKITDGGKATNLTEILASVLAEQTGDIRHNYDEGNASRRKNSPSVATTDAIEAVERQQEDEDKEEDPVERYNKLVGMYNLCLSHYAEGSYEEALTAVMDPFTSAMRSIKIIDNNAEGEAKVALVKGMGNEEGGNHDGTPPLAEEENQSTFFSTGYLIVTTRIAFLVLDCYFARLAAHAQAGVGSGGAGAVTPAVATAEEVLAWIESNMLSFAAKFAAPPVKGSEGEDGDGGVAREESHSILEQLESSDMKHDELRFRLHLYRSRMLLLRHDPKNTKGDSITDLETRTRLSRKELKNAMDIYQNKLSIIKVSEETTSVTSATGGGSLVTSMSEGSGGGAGAGMVRNASFVIIPNTGQQPEPQNQRRQASPSPSPPSSSTNKKAKQKKDVTPELQVRHEAVLYGKANLEFCRGNTLKAMKLCAEARSAGRKSRGVFVVAAAAAPALEAPAAEIAGAAAAEGAVAAAEGGGKKAESDCVEKKATLYAKGSYAAAAREAATGANAMENKRDSNDDRRAAKATTVEISTENKEVFNKDSRTTAKGNDAALSKTGTPLADGILDDADNDEETESQKKNYDEAIYYNNLALVHHSAGKVHLALRYYSYALSFAERIKSPNATVAHFWSNGLARPDLSPDILHNMSVCAFQAQDFTKAYVCMVQCCVTQSPELYGKRARCWLRLGQSCIGKMRI